MPESGFAHETHGPGKTNVWLTPPWILYALGIFDLDPCSAPYPQPWPTARKHYDITQGEDGLKLPWVGRIWLNPPYGIYTGKWIERLAKHGEGTALTFVRSETRTWVRHIWPKASAILFFKSRIAFCRTDGTSVIGAGCGSALIAYGERDAQILSDCQIPGALVKQITMKKA